MTENEEKRNAPETIQYYIHEGMLARLDAAHEKERAEWENSRETLLSVNKRWFKAFLVVFFAFVITNAGWIFRETQYEDVVTTVTQEASADSGGDAVVYGDRAGAVFYGESEANSYDQSPAQENGR